MPRPTRLMAAVLAVGCIPTLIVADTLRETEWAEIVLARELPDELTAPEGRTRWDLAALELGRRWTRAVESDSADPSSIILVERELASRYQDLSGGDGAARWLLPVRDPFLLEVAGVEPIDLQRKSDGEEQRLRIESRRVGLGWIHLPSGPREVVLQRALLYEGVTDRPSTLIHRWIDPRAGVVAEIRGPASPDGRSRLSIEGAALVEKETTRAKALQIYADQTDHPIYTRLGYGYDRGAGIAVSALTPDAHTTIGDMVGDTSWDFSGNNLSNAVAETASTTTEISEAETCSYNQCGFTQPGAKLSREDKNFDDPGNVDTTTTAAEREDRTGDVTIWMRAGINKEGQTGGLGDGESRICYVSGGRTEVPLWRFSHWDSVAEEYYMENGDSWTHGQFSCENNIFNHLCPNSCGLFCPIYICGDSCGGCGGFSGTQSTEIVNEGPVTLPSGHTFNALVLRSVAEFCAYLGSGCGLPVDQVRTVVYLWEVPYLGTVVRLMSDQVVPNATSFTTLAETDIKFGLFPPLSVTIDGGSITDSTMEVSWNPGTSETHRIDGYKIYWDTDTGGGAGGYDFSMTQSSASGTSATLAGLDSNTEYFVTVTSLSDFTDPASGVETRYESLLYPTTVGGGSGPLPVEASATTTCTPIEEVHGLTMNKVGNDIEMCWNASLDVCLTGYQIISADSPESDTNFSVLVEDTGLVTCHTFDPAESYFLVLSKGSGGTGRWGHYGR